MHAVSDTITTLNHLIEVCKDGEYGFLACAEYAKAARLRSQFQTRASTCRIAAAQLQVRVADLGGAAESSGTVAGTVHRGWVAVKAALSTFDDLAVLDEAERGEDAALRSYREALAQELPAALRALVEQQYEGVQRNHAMVRETRDAMRASQLFHA